jgi:hypothetical protein
LLLEAADKQGGMSNALTGLFLGGISPLHLLACWSPAGESRVPTDSDKKRGKTAAAARGNKARRESHSCARDITGIAGSGDWTEKDDSGVKEQLKAIQLLLTGRTTTDGKIIAGADVNRADLCRGNTPLTFAAYSGAVAAAELLLQYGADVNKPRNWDAARGLLMWQIGMGNFMWLACCWSMVRRYVYQRCS